jgi:hypothetical protein
MKTRYSDRRRSPPLDATHPARLKVYPGGPHGLADPHKEQIKPDLLSFLRS